MSDRITYDGAVVDEIIVSGVNVHLDAMGDGVYSLILSRPDVGDLHLTMLGDVGSWWADGIDVPVVYGPPLMPGHDRLDASDIDDLVPGQRVRVSVEGEVRELFGVDQGRHASIRTDIGLAHVGVGSRARVYRLGEGT